jgi:hypothetical protein
MFFQEVGEVGETGDIVYTGDSEVEGMRSSVEGGVCAVAMRIRRRRAQGQGVGKCY